VAKRSNLLGLAVLGVIVQRPMHRYEIATTIREQGKDDDMAVKWGSLYTVVGGLERNGFVEAVGVERDGARPERVTYRITAAGIREMKEWTRDLLRGAAPARQEFSAGLSMLACLPPEEVLEILRERVAGLQAGVPELKAALAGHAERVPRLFLVEDEYDIALREAELAWLRRLVAEIESGGFPGIDQWRHVQAVLGEDAPFPSQT
jgi:DNA-binding PadR family transcriptional regulator